jgi:hypothetical protein
MKQGREKRIEKGVEESTASRDETIWWLFKINLFASEIATVVKLKDPYADVPDSLN